MTGRVAARLVVAAGALLGLVSCAGRPGTDPITPTSPSTRTSPEITATTPAIATSPTQPPAATGHVVVVVMENHSYSDIVGNPATPYLNSLARRGRSFTDLRAVTHPSQPNYLALFTGSTRAVRDDSCPQHLSGPTLAGELLRAGRTFVGYSESLPGPGSAVCSAGPYARKHAPWTNFADLPTTVNQPFSAFPSDLRDLPTVSFVIPDLDHDMHDGTIAQADTWTRTHLGRYAGWAPAHHSLLVVTWDEDDHSEGNRIPTFVVGAGVPPGKLSTQTTLYGVLRAIEDRYGLPRLGDSASAPPLDLG